MTVTERTVVESRIGSSSMGNGTRPTSRRAPTGTIALVGAWMVRSVGRS